MQSQLLHAGLIAQNATLRALAGGVDGQHGQLAAFLFQHMNAKLIDRGGLASTRNAADAHSDGFAAIGQTFLDDLLGLGLMVGIDTLD